MLRAIITAGIGAAAVAAVSLLAPAPASAQSALTGQASAISSGQRAGFRGGFGNIRRGFGRDSVNSPHRDRRRFRHHRRGGLLGYPAFGLGFDGGTFQGDTFDGRGSDFFDAYSGPRTHVAGGRVHYDYDRSYPYDHYAGGTPQAQPPRHTASGPRCDTQWVPAVDGHGRAQVRVCRR